MKTRLIDGIEVSRSSGTAYRKSLIHECVTGQRRVTDCANAETLFRVIQSIPSPKVEPLKRWLAKVGKDRLDEIENPELAMGRMQDLYEKKGYPKEWIDKRLRGIAVRQDLTDEWKQRGVTNSQEFAILTMLGEATTTKLHRDRDSKGMTPLKKDAKDGGAVAGRTRKDIEKQSGKPVISPENFKQLEVKKVKKSKAVRADHGKSTGIGVSKTHCELPRSGAQISTFSISLANPIPLFGMGVDDPWLHVVDTNQDIHLNSVRDAKGFPFALMMPTQWRVPVEGQDMGLAYPEFINFVSSSGRNSANWYLTPATGKTVNWNVLDWAW